MRWSGGERRLWVTLAVLAALLVVLAVLQYRWIGEIGRADAERRQAQLRRSAGRLAAGLDRDLGQIAMALRVEPAPAGPGRRAAVLSRLAAWSSRGDRTPLVSGVLLAQRRESGHVSLESCSLDGSGCQPASWSGSLDELRQRLEQPPEGPGHEGAPFRPTLVEDPLALVVPMAELTDAAPAGMGWRGRFRVNGFTITELDPAYARERLFPQLAETYFGPLGESEYVVAVIRRADGSVLYASDADVRPDELRKGELQVPMPFTGRLDERHDPGRRLRPPQDADGDRDAARRASRDEDAPWLLAVRRRGGSLDRAVAAMRWRNLGIGLGVLALLGAAGVVLATGAQRARRLARQQIDFVAGVTHELNTPLAAIRSAGQNLADGIVTDPAQVRRYGALIEKEGRRLTSLVAQVLDFAGIGAAGKVYAAEPVSLAQITDEVLADMRLVLDQSGLAVVKDVPGDLPCVRGDAAALRRVLANLLANTAKFASSGKRVTIRAMAGTDGTVVLRVEDRGPGIPPPERRRVFEAFYRGSAAQRNDAPGSGLGLSLVNRVVQAHGGRVHVEDAPGGGTAVVLALPVATSDEERA